MKHIKLEEIIKRYIALPIQPNAKGWYPILCKICNDHGRKGLRASFNFNDGKICYHCFNCGHMAIYDPVVSLKPDDKMIKVLQSFEIPDNEWKPLILESLSAGNKRVNSQANTSQINTIEIEPVEIPLPNHFYRLGDKDSTDKWTIIARDYLEYDRSIDPDAYPFYLSKGGTDKESQKWLGRLIIPFYKENKLIFYQGRSLRKNVVRKYESPGFEKSRVLFGYDQILKNTNGPLFVVEGWFDAYSIDGVAILGSRLSKEQLIWLNKSKRHKVVIPDKYGHEAKLAKQALDRFDQGWTISVPDFLRQEDYKDVSDGVVKYGKLYVLKDIISHIAPTKLQAETAVTLFCNKKKR